jgi:molybdate transport system regulatory protein
MKNQYNLRGRIWIELGDKAFLGSGKADLLRCTARLGSLRQAALELGISYRQAWYTIDRLNKLAGSPVIIFQRGGKKGGSAVLTDFGTSILDQFDRSQEEFDSFLNRQNEISIT